MFDWIVVGAGFTGATVAERIASVLDRKVLVVDRRPHIAGNAFDCANEHGHLVHLYGPHLFHTNSEAVWSYLQAFSAWRPYTHRVRAVVEGREVPLPVNLDTIAALFPASLANRFEEKLLARFRYGDRVPVLKLRADPDPDLKALADHVYARIFENYTLKQWALRPEDLSPGVTARVPIVVSRDDRYFADRWQAMPARGYTALFEAMLSHRNIHLMLKTDWRDIAGLFPGARVVYTGPIDEYYDYRHGALPYRSLRFEFETHDVDRFQSVSTINFPGDGDFTRITEFKPITGQRLPKTTIVREYPIAHRPGETVPYYPIPRDETQALLDRYLADARGDPRVLFCGRLGDYRYYNMDQAVGAALALFNKTIKPRAG